MTFNLTRRAALAGATAIVTTAALPAMEATAAANAVRDDAELIALVDRFQELDAAHQAAFPAWCRAIYLEHRRPGFEHVTAEEIADLGHTARDDDADPEVRRAARQRLAEVTYLDDGGFPNPSPESQAAKQRAQPHRDRQEALWADLLEIERRVAGIPATTTAGAVAKLRVIERFHLSKEHGGVIASLLEDLARQASAGGRMA